MERPTRKRKNNYTMFEMRIDGEIEDEDFTYDYSGIDHNKLQ